MTQGLGGVATTNIAVVPSISSSTTAGSGAALLPAPGSASLDVGSAIGMLLKVSSQLSEQQMQSGKAQAEVAAGKRKVAAEKRREALNRAIDAARQAREAQEHSGGFFSFVADNIGLALAAAALTVASGGLAAPGVIALVGIGISTATQVAAKTGALQAVFGDEAAAYIAIGGAITGAALTLGGSAVCVAGNISNLASTSEALEAGAAGLNGARSVAEGAATVAEGIADLKAADYQHEADMAEADAKEQKHVMKRLERLIDGILDDLKEAKDAARRSTEILQSTLQTYNQTLLDAGSMKV